MLVSRGRLSLLALIVGISLPTPGSGLLANTGLELLGVELVPILQQEAIILHDLVLDLGQRSHHSNAPSTTGCHPTTIIRSSWGVLVLPLGRPKLILCDILSFHGFDQLLADAHNVGGEVRPFDLRVIKRLLCVLLLPLVGHQCLLHLGQSVTHLIVLGLDGGAGDRESIGL